MTVNQIKEWFTLMVSVVAVVAGVIFWVQTSNDSKIANIETQTVHNFHEINIFFGFLIFGIKRTIFYHLFIF